METYFSRINNVNGNNTYKIHPFDINECLNPILRGISRPLSIMGSFPCGYCLLWVQLFVNDADNSTKSHFVDPLQLYCNLGYIQLY